MNCLFCTEHSTENTPEDYVFFISKHGGAICQDCLLIAMSKLRQARVSMDSKNGLKLS